MRYLPHTDADIQQMLDRIGAGELADLFEQIPKALRQQTPLKLAPPLSESWS